MAYGQIIDSDITLEQALVGSEAPDDILRRMVIVDVEYYSSDSLLHRGQLVVDGDLESEMVEIFRFIKEIGYPVDMVIPIKADMPGGNSSMAHLNNSYMFHYRTVISGGTLSRHSLGRAIDFNPFNNPYVTSSGDMKPSGAEYDLDDSRTLHADHPLVKELKSRSWIWGGDWETPKDYMHFQKK